MRQTVRCPVSHTVLRDPKGCFPERLYGRRFTDVLVSRRNLGKYRSAYERSRRAHPLRHGARLVATRAVLVLLVFTATQLVLPKAAHDEGPSYQAGYTAASNPKLVRAALTEGGMSTAAFCDELLKRAIIGVQQTGIHNRNFYRGCEHAIHDVME
jgi:hypothetical protein